MDNNTESAFTNNGSDWDISTIFAWKSTMHRALQTFGMRNKEFQFRKFIIFIFTFIIGIHKQAS